MTRRISTPTPNSSIARMSATAIAALAHQFLFQRIDRADAEQIELIGRDRGARLVAEQMVEAGLAAEERRRHAVHVAGEVVAGVL